MDFSLTDEQRLLEDSVARLLADRYDFAARRIILASPTGWSVERWADYAELGLHGLTVAETEGGFGGGAVETMLVMQAFGRALVLEPFLASTVLGGTALRAAGHRPLLPGLLDGSVRLAFAHDEPGVSHGLSRDPTQARQVGGRWRLDGHKSLVLHGATADHLVVSAVAEAGEPTLFLTPRRAPGLTVQPTLLVDGSRAATIRLEGVVAERLAGEGLVARVIETGLAAVCAEAVGVMETAQALTVDYLNTRQQFGRPIGRNQALQHRMAEMLVALEQARSMSLVAAMAIGLEAQPERQKALSQAKVQIARSGRLVAQAAVQLHGGIGVTEEYAVGHCLRRLMVLERLFGDSTWHLRRLGSLIE